MPTPRLACSVLALTASIVACAPAAAPPSSTPPPLPVAVRAASPTPPSSTTAGLDGFAPGTAAAAGSIRPEALASHIRFLADDLLEGREPGTRGYELGARYVASELQALGLQPAGDDGTFFQKVEMVHSTLVSASLDLVGGSGPVLKLLRDVDLVAHKLPIDQTAELIFVGHGLDVPEYHYDDFAGVDVRGKIVVRFGRAPRSERADFFPPLASAIYGDTDRITADLQRRGAIAVLQVQTPEMTKLFYPFSFLVQNGRFPSISLAHGGASLPGGRMDYTALDKMLKKAGRSETATQLAEAAARGPTHAFSLGKAHLHVEVKQHPIFSENVVALVPADPASPTKDEMVMYGAHLDHMGIGDPVKGDAIYNGASDDAAGVSSLLETARAFTVLSRTTRPRRKILFLFVTAEERGLLGSEYFAEHPTVPLHDIVADIDVDAGYPLAPIKDIVPLGTEESTLGIDAARAAHALGLEVGGDEHPEQFFFVRSDQYSFVKKGVPAAQILQGELGMSKDEKERTAAFWKGRYHQPQDEYEPNRDWRPFAEMTRYDFLLGLSIAQRLDRPTWNAKSFFRRFPEPALAR